MATISRDHVSERTFEHKWVIRNWQNVVQNEDLINETKTEIQCKIENVLVANFVVGTTLLETSNNITFYCKLVEKHHLDIVPVTLQIQILDKNGEEWDAYKIHDNAEVERIMRMKGIVWRFNKTNNISNTTDSEGSLVVLLKLTVKNIPDVVLRLEQEIRQVCRNEFNQQMAALVNDRSSSDVKFLTKDNIELFAHRAILSARCQIFSSMFGSEFLENSTGVVNVDDISAKTMKILLSYWYTGELLPYWTDDDIVVEFTYAAGKYQMTQVLKLLDTLLPNHLKKSRRNVELLKIVQQLSLKNAESRILKFVVHEISQSKSEAELLNSTLLANSKVNEENFTVSQVLEAFDNALSEGDDKIVSFIDIQLLSLACKFDRKNVADKLFKRIVGTVQKIESADDFFALFPTTKGTVIHDSSDCGLLVRSNPTERSVN